MSRRAAPPRTLAPCAGALLRTTRRAGARRRCPRTLAPCAGALLALVACGAPSPDDLGWIDDTLSPSGRVDWPGVDRGDTRVIPFIGGFGEGEPSGYWFLGFANRETIDSFWFCREGDDACPLDAHQRVRWESLVGGPLFSRVPGDPHYSFWWWMWTVTVPVDFAPNSIRTIGTLYRAVGAGRVRVERTVARFASGPSEAIVHCALVLRGTQLEDNGGAMPDGRGRRLRLERHEGWRQGFRVALFDFSPAEGVFAAADDSGSRPRMPFANIYILRRRCDGDPRPAICSLPGDVSREWRPVSEPGIGQDLTGDGDTEDTNNVMGALPCREASPGERPYSPLWAVHAVDVPAGSPLRLVDDSGDQTRSDVTSAAQIQAAVAAGALLEPVPQEGRARAGPGPAGDRQLFFNCPAPVPEDHVPDPCPGATGG